jgi:hypothetical protein
MKEEINDSITVMSPTEDWPKVDTDIIDPESVGEIHDLELVKDQVELIMAGVKLGYLMTGILLEDEEKDAILFDFCAASQNLLKVANDLMLEHNITPEDLVIRRMAMDMYDAQGGIS